MFFGSFRDKLVTESKNWIDDEIITNDQLEKIFINYDNSENKKNSVGYYLLMSFGALFFGVAFMLLMSHNWDNIPGPIKTISLFTFTLTINVIGAHMFIKGKEQLGSILLLFGSLMFGVSIMLIAQIYHLGDYYPDGIFWWVMGIVPIMLLTKNRFIAMLVIVLSTLWMITDFTEGFFPLSYPIFALLTLGIALYFEKSKALFFLSFCGLAHWIFFSAAFQFEHYYKDFSGEVLFLLLSSMAILSYGFVLRLFSISIPLFSSYKNTEINWGEYSYFIFKIMLFTSLVTLFFLSFKYSWRLWDVKDLDGALILFPILAFLFSISINMKSDLFSKIFISSISLYITLSILMLTVFSSSYSAVALLTNVFLFFSGLGLIYYGVNSNRVYCYYIGLISLISLALVRYFDLIGDYIGSAIIFAVSACILIASARFWKNNQEKKLENNHE